MDFPKEGTLTLDELQAMFEAEESNIELLSLYARICLVGGESTDAMFERAQKAGDEIESIQNRDDWPLAQFPQDYIKMPHNSPTKCIIVPANTIHPKEVTERLTEIFSLTESIMRMHNFKIRLLRELVTGLDSHVQGSNQVRGNAIGFRLRDCSDDSPEKFYSVEYVALNMLHELVHNVIDNHTESIHTLLNELIMDFAELHPVEAAKGQQEHRTINGGEALKIRGVNRKKLHREARLRRNWMKELAVKVQLVKEFSKMELQTLTVDGKRKEKMELMTLCRKPGCFNCTVIKHSFVTEVGNEKATET